MELTKEELMEMIKAAVRQGAGPSLKGAYSPAEEGAPELMGKLIRKALTSGETPFLPQGVAKEVIKAAERGASVRPYATVRQVSESTGRVPVARPATSAYWVAEDAQPPAESEPQFTYVAWTAHKLKAYTKVTREALEDNSVDIAAEVIDSLGRAIRYTEEQAFWFGDGSGKPTGIDTVIPSSWVIDGTGQGVLEVINAAYTKLPVEFRERARWFANSNTKATLLGLKDTTGRPLLVPSLSGTFPWSIYGRPVVEVPTLPDNVLYFGDMGFYYIFQRKEMELRVTAEGESLTLADEVLVSVSERLDGTLVWDDAGGITPFVKVVNLGQ